MKKRQIVLRNDEILAIQTLLDMTYESSPSESQASRTVLQHLLTRSNGVKKEERE